MHASEPSLPESERLCKTVPPNGTLLVFMLLSIAVSSCDFLIRKSLCSTLPAGVTQPEGVKGNRACAAARPAQSRCGSGHKSGAPGGGWGVHSAAPFDFLLAVLRCVLFFLWLWLAGNCGSIDDSRGTRERMGRSAQSTSCLSQSLFFAPILSRRCQHDFSMARLPNKPTTPRLRKHLELSEFLRRRRLRGRSIMASHAEYFE